MSGSKNSGVLNVPVFPLPYAVLFPNVKLHLRAHEIRYRRLVEFAKNHDGLVVVALLKKGWIVDYYGTPPTYDIACVGEIIEFEPHPRGGYHLTLLGKHRVRILKYTQMEPFRIAKVKIIDETGVNDSDPKVKEQKEILLNAYNELIEETGEEQAYPNILSLDDPFDNLINEISYRFNHLMSRKQLLLEKSNIGERYTFLLDLIKDRLLHHYVSQQLPDSPQEHDSFS